MPSQSVSNGNQAVVKEFKKNKLKKKIKEEPAVSTEHGIKWERLWNWESEAAVYQCVQGWVSEGTCRRDAALTAGREERSAGSARSAQLSGITNNRL